MMTNDEWINLLLDVQITQKWLARKIASGGVEPGAVLRINAMQMEQLLGRVTDAITEQVG